MYVYNLIIKRGDLDDAAARAMVNQQLTRRFYPAIGYTISALLDNEIVVQVRDESKRSMQVTLGDWFNEGLTDAAPYPDGTLLHYREILPSESIYNSLGG